jgi:hypothetical protein
MIIRNGGSKRGDGMSRITTGKFANAIKNDCPGVNDDMVRDWCEQGYLETWQNPTKDKYARYFIFPRSIPEFLRQHLKFTEERIQQAIKFWGIDHTQLSIF